MRAKKRLLLAITHVLTLCVVVFSVSVALIHSDPIIGFMLLLLGILCLVSVRIWGISVTSLGPDIAFGVIDNGILAVMAVFGGRIAGVPGAVIGGVVGNAITDGIAGIFEGYWAESLIDDRRTLIGSAVGKMAGCLLGAGGVIIFLGTR